MASENIDDIDSQERREIARAAATDIVDLARAVRAVPEDGAAAVRTLTLRIEDLADIVISAVDDAAEKTVDLWASLNVGEVRHG